MWAIEIFSAGANRLRVDDLGRERDAVALQPLDLGRRYLPLFAAKIRTAARSVRTEATTPVSRACQAKRPQA
jgi:hypothetical protein